MRLENRRLPELDKFDAYRFWSNVEVGRQFECWPWRGTRNEKGYGKFGIGRVGQFTASRIAFRLHVGEDPNDGLILHTCNNPPCCNPGHLYCGDLSDNAIDAVLAGSHPTVKLTYTDVVRIRRLYKAGRGSTRHLAEMFGVGQSQIMRIIHWKTWGRQRYSDLASVAAEPTE